MKPRHASPQQQPFVSGRPYAVQRTRQRLGLKICKVPPSLNLILAPGDPSSGRRKNSSPVPKPSGSPAATCPPSHRPPGAASSFLILPRSVTKSRQRAVPVIGYRSGGSAGAVLPPFRQGLHETGYIEGQIVIIEGQIVIILGLSFLDTLRRTEHVARGSLWKRFDVTAQ